MSASVEVAPLEQLLGWAWPEWVTAPLNDGIEVFALPKRLTRALGKASSAELEELAGRGITLRGSGPRTATIGPTMIYWRFLQGVARLAASAAHTGGGLYSWSY
ncbi:hypothetical protein ACFWOY_25765 [Streptomyces sp. NPDC058423]|uniref:hypothetical protein n=1 Tax=unclassified Streptomyces TaxID=2593676 RepID=UPI003668A35B